MIQLYISIWKSLHGHLNKEKDINGELEKVNTCLNLNKLSLNAQKTILMVCHTSKNMLMKSMFKLMVQRSNVWNHLAFLV